MRRAGRSRAVVHLPEERPALFLKACAVSKPAERARRANIMAVLMCLMPLSRSVFRLRGLPYHL